MSVILTVLVGMASYQLAVAPHPATVAMLVVQLLVCLPATRRLRGWWAIAAQVALLPWGGLGYFAAASALLIARGRARWVLFAAVVAASGPRHARAARTPSPPTRATPSPWADPLRPDPAGRPAPRSPGGARELADQYVARERARRAAAGRRTRLRARDCHRPGGRGTRR
ncbi:hypothetical protein NKH77_39275 [Streptomyces sp. M19]